MGELNSRCQVENLVSFPLDEWAADELLEWRERDSNPHLTGLKPVASTLGYRAKRFRSVCDKHPRSDLNRRSPP